MPEENIIPYVKPAKGVQEYETKQSKYSMVPELPVRSIILGPSGSGKTILLQNMVLDIKIASVVYIYFHLQLMLILHGYLLRNISKNH